MSVRSAFPISTSDTLTINPVGAARFDSAPGHRMDSSRVEGMTRVCPRRLPPTGWPGDAPDVAPCRCGRAAPFPRSGASQRAGSSPAPSIGPHGSGRPNQLSRGMFRSWRTLRLVREGEELPHGEETAVSGFESRLAHWVATDASDSMSTEATEKPTDDMDWRQEIVAEQFRGVPKERGRTYYYADGLFDRKQMWLKHNPGCDISMRVTKVWQPGIFGDEYDSSLQMNIGTEMDAYRLYRALEAYFNDVRTPPWFLQDVEVSD